MKSIFGVEDNLDSAKLELTNWFLNQQVTELDNTLSNTIALFSAILAAISVAFLAIAWYMNRVFTKKLNQVEKESSCVKDYHDRSEIILGQMTNIENAVNDKFYFIRDSETEVKKLMESAPFYTNYLELLEDAIRQQGHQIAFYNLELEILKLEPKISSEAIENFDWGNISDTPQSSFEHEQNNYLEAKSNIIKLDINTFIDKNFEDGSIYVRDDSDKYMVAEDYKSDLYYVKKYRDYLRELVKLSSTSALEDTE